MKRILFFLLLISSLAKAQVADKYITQNTFQGRAEGIVADGVTNNTAAWKKLVAKVIAKGGGLIQLPFGVIKADSFPIPAQNPNNYIPIKIVGEGTPLFYFGTSGTSAMPSQGTILLNLSTTGTAALHVDAWPAGNLFSGIYLEIADLEVRTYDDPSIGGLDAGYASFLKLTNVFISTGVYTTTITRPSHATAGLTTPLNNNAAMTLLNNVTVCGYANGIMVNEHTYGDYLNVLGCINGLNFQTANHSSMITRIGMYSNTHNIYVSGINRFIISEMNIEHDSSSNAYQTTIDDVRDTANIGVGDITWADVKGNVGRDAVFTKTGGSGVQSRIMGSASSGGASQWTTVGSGIYYNGGFTGMGANMSNPLVDVHIRHDQNTATVLRVQNNTAGTGSDVQLQAMNDLGNYISYGINSSTTTAYGRLVANGGFMYNSTTPGISIMEDANGPITFSTGTGAPAAERMRIQPSGNVDIGTTTDIAADGLIVAGATNGSWQAAITNTNASTAALSALQLNAGTATGYLYETSQGYTATPSTLFLYNGTNPIDIVGAAVLTAPTTTLASLNFPSGTAKTTPAQGDMYYDGTHLYFKPSGTLVDLLAGGGGGSQWTTSGSNIYYTTGNVMIGTTTNVPTVSLQAVNTNNGNQLILVNNLSSGTASLAGLEMTAGTATGYIWENSNGFTGAASQLNIYNGTNQILLTGAAVLSAPTTTLASLNFPSGTAKTTPAQGDMYYDGTHLYFKPSGTLVDLLASGGSTPSLAAVTAVGATATNDITMRHLLSNGSTPTQSSLGTNVTSITITGTDMDYNVSVVTSGAVSGTICVINLASAYASAPNPVVCVGQFNTAITNLAIGAATGTNTIAGSISGSGTYIIRVHNLQ